jgi:hypothetical protein
LLCPVLLLETDYQLIDAIIRDIEAPLAAIAISSPNCFLAVTAQILFGWV